MNTAQAIKTATQMPLTLKQLANLSKFAGEGNVQKTVTTLITVPNSCLENPTSLKSVIGNFLFDTLTDNTNENGLFIVGKYGIENVEIQEYQILNSSPTLFQRTNIVVDVTFLMSQKKM